MDEFPFKWQLKPISMASCSAFPIPIQNNRYISNLKINAEWSLVCLWREDQCYGDYRPEILEIRRNSTAKEILVSGTYKLILDGSSAVRQRKFVQLIEAGSATTEIVLESPTDKCSYTLTRYSYSMNGTLKIPANTVNNVHAKGVQFQSLLDLSNHFESLLDPNAACFSDVTVNCGTVSFPAHKNILSARSPVFAAMFATKMKENRDNKVDITDISPQILKTMLTYIYCGKTGELSVQTAGELLFAADKYQLDDLKRVCSDYLKSCVSAENVLRTLVLGYLHDKELNVFAIDYICSSCEDFEVIEKTVEWKNLQEKRPSLAMEVLTGLVKSKDKLLKNRK